MAKRLLSVEQALKKIELSLKLQGKELSPEYLDCSHCKYSWGNIPGGRPIWPSKFNYHDPRYHGPEDNPRPDKAYWNCFKYANNPSHANIRFKVIRRDAEGKEVYFYSLYRYDYTLGRQVPTRNPGETDELVIVPPGKRFKSKVCRRFEANSKK